MQRSARPGATKVLGVVPPDCRGSSLEVGVHACCTFWSDVDEQSLAVAESVLLGSEELKIEGSDALADPYRDSQSQPRLDCAGKPAARNKRVADSQNCDGHSPMRVAAGLQGGAHKDRAGQGKTQPQGMHRHARVWWLSWGRRSSQLRRILRCLGSARNPIRHYHRSSTTAEYRAFHLGLSLTKQGGGLRLGLELMIEQQLSVEIPLNFCVSAFHLHSIYLAGGHSAKRI